MTSGVEPHRALALPDLQRVRRLAGASAFVAGAARPIKLRAGGSEIGAVAKSLVGQRNRPVRISFPRCDAVAKAGDQDVAHLDRGGDVLRRVGTGDVNGGVGGAAVTNPEIDRLGAIERRLPRAVAIIERPGADRADRNLPGQFDRNGMIGGRQIVFLDVITGAGVTDPSREIDTKPIDDVARPAAAVALLFQRVFRCEDAAGLGEVGMKLEVAFLAEQPEAVAHFPANLHRSVRCCGRGILRHGCSRRRRGSRLGDGPMRRRCGEQSCQQD